MAGKRISIDEKIERAKEDVTRAKKKYDAAVEALEKLMTKKKEMQQKELLQAFADSGKSYDEIMQFLKA
ncbi:MAG: ErpK protein [Mogibacterium sp.]|nr:ErpK protein [Mogibacterium sp.]